MAIDVERLKNDPVAFDAHRAAEIARRAEWAKNYPGEAATIENQIASSLPSGIKQEEVLLRVQGRNEEEDEKLNEVRKVHKQMAEIGTIPATVVNLLPWAVQANGRYLMYPDMTVPECPIGQPFERLVIRNYKIDIEDKAGRFGAAVITPIALANDIVGQLEPMDRGGLFQYMGDHLPGEHPDNRFDPEMKKTVLCKRSLEELSALDKAKKAMVKNFRRMYREAEGFFQQPARKALQNITENHRRAAQWLFHYRLISTLPPWVSATAADDQGLIPDLCTRCGADISEAGFACPECNFIMDAFGAYQAGEIEEEHHAMRRLSREQLDVLGLQHILTLAEYREAKRNGEIEADAPEPTDPPTGKNKHKAKNKAAHRKAQTTEVREKEDHE